MVKKLFQVSAVLVTSLAAATGWAQDAGGAFRRPAVIACNPSGWTDEARRYELEGTTVLQYDVDDDGRPSSVRVTRGSGWKILDHMAIRAIESCRFEQTSDPQVVRAGLTQTYRWKLADNGQTPVPAALVASSCQPSVYFGAFLPVTGNLIRRADGIAVRFLLDEGGNTFGMKSEETDPAVVSAASALIKSCRFTPAMLDGKPARGNMYGWLIVK
ncbi:energy transducer TonB [Massilia pseudoviolaceinigra]|uniref:energy transducer TonB n=1 Tax=Massilia pseudoviolaceinigra TaxID=3057165 RepID=UPI0027968B7E|nr:energy transducer TonB [Massilia sp. CCM 9206]MDQ1919020.1 energy transducer TonB [Massilia sp. CCM 9206]